MTDPLTLLEDHRPVVPDARPEERAAARAVLDAAIDAESAASLAALWSHDGWPSARRRLLGAAVALVVAGGVASGVLLRSSDPPSSDPPSSSDPRPSDPPSEGWDPVAQRIPPEEAAQLEADCREQLDGSVLLPGIPPGLLQPVHVDRRGTVGIALFAGMDGEKRVLANCVLVSNDHLPEHPDPRLPSRSPGEWRVAGHGAGTTPDLDPLTEHFLHIYGGGAHGSGSGYSTLIGQVDDTIARVEVVADGQSLEALLTDGYFSVVWPSAQDPGQLEARAFDAAGELVDTYDLSMPTP
jgi:hypothetical protein